MDPVAKKKTTTQSSLGGTTGGGKATTQSSLDGTTGSLEGNASLEPARGGVVGANPPPAESLHGNLRGSRVPGSSGVSQGLQGGGLDKLVQTRMKKTQTFRWKKMAQGKGMGACRMAPNQRTGKLRQRGRQLVGKHRIVHVKN